MNATLENLHNGKKEKDYKLLYKTEIINDETDLPYIGKYTDVNVGNFETYQFWKNVRKEVASRRNLLLFPDVFGDTKQQYYSISSPKSRFRRELEKPSAVTKERQDITFEDASRLNLKCKAIKELMTLGKNNIPLIHEAYDLAASKKITDTNRLQRIIKTGLKVANLSLEEACEIKLLLPELTKPEIWQENGITKLSDVFKTIRSNPKIVGQFNSSVIDHIETYMPTGIKNILEESVSQLGGIIRNDPDKLKQMNIRYMYEYK